MRKPKPEQQITDELRARLQAALADHVFSTAETAAVVAQAVSGLWPPPGRAVCGYCGRPMQTGVDSTIAEDGSLDVRLWAVECPCQQPVTVTLELRKAEPPLRDLRRHDRSCESEFVHEAGAWSSCACDARADARRDGFQDALAGREFRAAGPATAGDGWLAAAYGAGYLTGLEEAAVTGAERSDGVVSGE